MKGNVLILTLFDFVKLLIENLGRYLFKSFQSYECVYPISTNVFPLQLNMSTSFNQNWNFSSLRYRILTLFVIPKYEYLFQSKFES
jgi:hypothetical protein